MGLKSCNSLKLLIYLQQLLPNIFRLPIENCQLPKS